MNSRSPAQFPFSTKPELDRASSDLDEEEEEDAAHVDPPEEDQGPPILHLKDLRASLACTNPGCSRTFRNLHNLHRHLNECGHNLKCETPGCSAEFGTRHELNKHMKECGKSFACPNHGCERVFSHRCNLTTHLKVCGVPLVCLCKVTYSTLNALKNHQAGCEIWIKGAKENVQARELFNKLEQRDLEGIKQVVLEHPHILNVQDEEGNSALHHACLSGIPQLVHWLVSQPTINVNHINKSGKSPFFLACEEGNKSTVEAMLACPSTQLNEINKGQKTPLVISCERNHHEIVKMLIADPRIEINKMTSTATALATACNHGCLESLEVLLSHPDLEVNKRMSKGSTGLHIAAHRGHVALIKRLLKHPKIDPNPVNYHGTTPILAACSTGKNMAIHALLEDERTRADKPDNGGQTPLWSLAMRNMRLLFIRILASGREVNVETTPNGEKYKPRYQALVDHFKRDPVGFRNQFKNYKLDDWVVKREPVESTEPTEAPENPMELQGVEIKKEEEYLDDSHLLLQEEENGMVLPQPAKLSKYMLKKMKREPEDGESSTAAPKKRIKGSVVEPKVGRRTQGMAQQHEEAITMLLSLGQDSRRQDSPLVSKAPDLDPSSSSSSSTPSSRPALQEVGHLASQIQLPPSLSSQSSGFWASAAPSSPVSPFGDNGLILQESQLRDATNVFSHDNFIAKSPLGDMFKGHIWGLSVVVHKLSAEGAEQLTQLQKSLSLFSNLCHPRLLGILGEASTATSRYLVQALPGKGTLTQRIADGSLTLKSAISIAHQLASTLYFLHELKKASPSIPTLHIRSSDVFLHSDFSCQVSPLLTLSNTPTPPTVSEENSCIQALGQIFTDLLENNGRASFLPSESLKAQQRLEDFSALAKDCADPQSSKLTLTNAVATLSQLMSDL